MKVFIRIEPIEDPIDSFILRRIIFGSAENFVRMLKVRKYFGTLKFFYLALSKMAFRLSPIGRSSLNPFLFQFDSSDRFVSAIFSTSGWLIPPNGRNIKKGKPSPPSPPVPSIESIQRSCESANRVIVRSLKLRKASPVSYGSSPSASSTMAKPTKLVLNNCYFWCWFRFTVFKVAYVRLSQLEPR